VIDLDDVQAYVRVVAPLMELQLDDAQVLRISQHLQRTAAMAAQLQAVPLSPADELAEIYSPAPYPGSST
jgi:hypothetical protein